MKVHVINSLNIQGVFSLVTGFMYIISIYDSPNHVSDKGLFHLCGETSYLFTTSI